MYEGRRARGESQGEYSIESETNRGQEEKKMKMNKKKKKIAETIWTGLKTRKRNKHVGSTPRMHYLASKFIMIICCVELGEDKRDDCVCLCGWMYKEVQRMEGGQRENKAGLIDLAILWQRQKKERGRESKKRRNKNNDNKINNNNSSSSKQQPTVCSLDYWLC
jgi:hypothetical protein